MRKIVLCAFVLLFCLSIEAGASATAQTPSNDPVELIQERASHVVAGIMQRNSLRTARFNQEMSKINLLRPLDAVNLDSAHIPATTLKMHAFLDFLGQYRDSSTAILRTLEDSVAALRADMPHEYQETFLSKFLAAYTQDSKAFDGYTLAISSLDKQVAEILHFLEHAKHGVVNNMVKFNDADIYKDYQALMKTLNERNADLAKASQLPRQTQPVLQESLNNLFPDPGQ
jgi:hypothetical protein